MKQTLLAAMGLLAFRAFAAPPAAPAAPSDGLFTPVPNAVAPQSAAPAGGQAADRTILRSQVTRVNLDALHHLAHGAAFRLSLFADAAPTAVFDRAETHANGMVSYFGRIQGDDLGEFSLVENHGVLAGVIRAPRTGGLYRVDFLADDLQAIRQIEPQSYAECATGPKDAITAPIVPAAGKPGPPGNSPAGNGPAGTGPSGGGSAGDSGCGDNAAEYTVAVFYTNVTRAAAGGTAAIEAQAQAAVDATNTAYANSGITSRVRMVYTGEVTYNEVGSYDDHLNRLTSASDGIMDGVFAIRNQYGADEVCLLVEDGAFCGKGWVMTTLSNSFQDHAFCVVNRGCSAGNWSMAHEIGHNQGCAHNREDADSSHLYDYSYGWRFVGNPSGKKWRTVMSYDTSPGQYARIGYFSNPYISYDGTPTGVPIGQANQSYNTQTINNSAATTANFRLDGVWVDFSYTGLPQTGCFAFPYKTLAAGVNAVPDKESLTIKAGHTAEKMTITKPMTIHSYGGSAILGQ